MLEKLRGVLGLEPRRIHKDDLSIVVRCHTEHTVARRLRLFRGNRDLFAHNRIDERRLADVGTTDDSGVSAAVVLRNLFFIAHAGSSQHRFKIVVAHRNSAREPLHSCRGGSAASFLNSVK